MSRIVSLLPSATEIAVALGFEGDLVGRSHECDFPPAMAALPRLTSTKIEKGLPSRLIDDRVQAIVTAGLSCYAVDAPTLRDLKPDVVLTQSQCAVCAVTPDDLVGALSDWQGNEPVLVSLAPDDLNDVWGDFGRVAQALGVPERAAPVVAALKARLAAIAETAAAQPTRPTVAAIEWIDPLMVAGNWVPELIEAAGGTSLFALAGQHSPWTEWDALVAADPDVIVMMPCGFQIAQTLGDLSPLTDRPGWADLKAVREDRVFVSDGHHFFNRPGPRLIESAEILAEVIHPSAFSFGHEGRGWVRLARGPQAA
jgi:iron complex transport system substrate-binding protein